MLFRSTLEGLGVGLMLGGYLNREKQGEEYTDSEGAVRKRDPQFMFRFGIGAYVAGALCGIYAASIYGRPGALAGAAVYPPLNIGLVSNTRGDPALQLSFTKRF